MGENHFAPWPVALYAAVQFFAAVAYFVLTRTLLSLHGADSALAAALGSDVKGKVSVGSYLLAIPAALLSPWITVAVLVLVAVMWLAPDPRIEKTLVR